MAPCPGLGNTFSGCRRAAALAAALLVASFPSALEAAEEQGLARLELRRTLKSREYAGRLVEGEEEIVQPGDTLWRILIQKRKVPEKLFPRYVTLVLGFNPHIADPNLLVVGARIFIPLRGEDLGAPPPAPAGGGASIYRVRPGDTLAKILREQTGARGKEELARQFARVRALNPEKKNWDLLIAGETIRLPEPKAEAAVGESAPRRPSAEPAFWQRLAEALEAETARSGEEVIASPYGEVVIDRRLFPVFRNPRSGKRVVLDLGGSIPGSIRPQLEASPSVSVLSVRPSLSLGDAVKELLRGLGYQTLSPHQPLVVGDSGAALHVQGDWMFITGESDTTVWVLTLSDSGQTLPDYLRDYLLARGVKWQEIARGDGGRASEEARTSALNLSRALVATLPPERAALIDELLRRWGAKPSEKREVSLHLREGIRWSVRFDRVAETKAKKLGVLFRTAHPELKKAFAQSGEWEVVELPPDLAGREVVGRLLAALGEKAAYGTHAFPLVKRDGVEKLTAVARGFFVAERSLLLTDGKMPPALERHLGERGIGIVYFR